MKRIGLAALGMLLAGAGTAEAQLSMQMSNGWNLTFAGNVNAFYIYSSGSGTSDIDGGLTSTADAGGIGTGLLPAFATFEAKGKEGNTDLSVYFGFAPQVQQGRAASFFGSQSAGAQIDMRQVFLTVGGSWGTIKAGKDLALYSRQNILTDMTIFGVGTAGVGGRGTALGRIGYGYQYPDFRGQFTYSTAAGKPAQFSIGISEPAVLAGDDTYDVLKLPRLETELTYGKGFGDGNKFTFFASGLLQNAENAADESLTAWGGAGGIKVDFSGVSIVGSGYYSKGLGTTFTGSVSGDNSGFAGWAVAANGEGRKAYGWIGQATVTPKGSKVTIGASIGESRLDLADGEVNDELVRRNRSYVGLISYQITKSLRWVGEYTRSESTNHGGDPKNTANQGATGLMLFF